MLVLCGLLFGFYLGLGFDLASMWVFIDAFLWV